MKGISIIVPYLNESDCILDFCAHIEKKAQNIKCDVEVVFVDDGSNDDTSKLIADYNFIECKNIKIVKLSKNYGSHAAVRAGLQYVEYEYIIFMAADMQEPDDMLEQAYQKMEQGYDAVYIEKDEIKVGRVSRAFSLIYAWLMRTYAVKNYGSGGINNIMFNEKIKDYLNSHIESNSSLNLQIVEAGFKATTLKLKYKQRGAGKSKWTFGKKIKLLVDSFVAFSFMPIRLVSIIGIFIFFIGLVMGVITIVNKLTTPNVPLGYSTIASIVALGFGITNISLGIIAEYLWRTYDAARNRPVFLVSNVEKIK